MSQEPEIFSADMLRAASERREAGQLKGLIARAKRALKTADLEVEAGAVRNPLQAMLTLALVEKWDVMRFLDEVSAYAISSAPENGPESFDDAVRAAWLAAGGTFDTATLLCGLNIAYSSAVKDGGAPTARVAARRECQQQTRLMKRAQRIEQGRDKSGPTSGAKIESDLAGIGGAALTPEGAEQ